MAMLKAVERRGLGRALRNVGWLMTGRGIGAVLSLVYLALATRALGLDGFGRFAIINGFGQGVSLFCGVQTWQAIVHFGADGPNQGRSPGPKALARLCFRVEIAGAALGVAIAGLLLFTVPNLLGQARDYRLTSFLFSAALLLSFRSTAIGALRLNDHYRLGALADSVTPVLRLIGALMLFLGTPSVEGFLIVWAVSELATAIFYRALVRAYCLSPAAAASDADMVKPAGLASFLFSANVGPLLANGLKPASVVIVGAVVGPAAAGGYRLASQLGQALARIGDLLSRGFFGEFALTRAQLDHSVMAGLFRQSARIALGLGFALSLLILLAGRPLLNLVAGPDFIAAYPLLLIFALGATFEIASFAFEPFLLAAGRQNTLILVRLAGFAVAATFLVVLINRYAATGAAFALAAGSLLFYVAAGILGLRLSKRAPEYPL